MIASMTVFDFFGACVAVAVAVIAVRAFWWPAKQTPLEQRENWQPTGGQDAMIVNDAVISHESSGSSGGSDA
jgi:hypothetical protein